MTINPPENSSHPLAEPPLTPTNDGKLEFLGGDIVKYISPPRVEQPRVPVRPVPPPPPQVCAPPTHSQPPPSYNSSVYPQYQPPTSQMIAMPSYQSQFHPHVHPMPQFTSPPSMVYMPTVPQPVMTMATPMMMTHAPPVQITPPQITSPPNITLNVNTSPQSLEINRSDGSGGGGGSGVLVCPKCRKGIVTRQQARLRKKILIVLGVFCCPLTCCIPLVCLCCNYVDACACCGKEYGHRGRKSQKKSVNAVKL